MQQTASIPTAHHSPFGLCLLLVLLLLAVATYSDYFTLTSVHVCLSCSSGVLYRSSNADYAGESSPLQRLETCATLNKMILHVLLTRLRRATVYCLLSNCDLNICKS